MDKCGHYLIYIIDYRLRATIFGPFNLEKIRYWKDSVYTIHTEFHTIFFPPKLNYSKQSDFAVYSARFFFL